MNAPSIAAAAPTSQTPRMAALECALRATMAAVYERRTGPRKVAVAEAPASRWIPGGAQPARTRFLRSPQSPGPLPQSEAEIAFAPVTALSRWIESRALTSTRLTQIYLDRLQRFDEKLRCTITLTRDLALEQAARADAEIRRGRYRGPLQGIPWGAKDLVDTKGIATTYGAEPFRNRVPETDAAVVERLDRDAAAGARGLRLGYVRRFMQENPATDVDRAALETARKIGMTPVEVELPDWPYASLLVILFAESAAAFEELTLSHGVDALKMQVPDAWPNTFRQSRFLSAVDFVQADRLRRKVAEEMARVFASVDLLLVPSLRDEMLTITNCTGHPSLTLRAGFVEVSEARSDWAPDPAHP